MENETRFSNRRLFIALAAGALLLALVAGILIVILVLGDEEPGEAAAAASAKLMPQDTFGFAAFNPHLDQAQNFEVLEEAWGDHPLVKKGLSEMLSSMKEDGLDYRQEIETWLGDEVAFGMGPDFLAAMSGFGAAFGDLGDALGGGLAPSSAAGAMPEISQIIVAAATKDRAASDRFLDKLHGLAEEDGITWQETTHAGVKVVYHEPGSEGDVGLAYATLGFDGDDHDYVVLTVGGLESMRAVIDARDGANLSDNQAYQDVLSRLPADQIGYGYVDMGAYMDAMMESAGRVLGWEPTELFNFQQLEAMKGVGYSFGLEANGMRMDFVATYDKEALSEGMMGTQALSDKISRRVPADTLFYLSGSGLGSVIQMGLDAVKAMPDQPPDLDEQLQMMTGLLGVSVEDLIDMLSGEFAIAVTHDPSGIGGDPSAPVGVGFLMESKDEDKFKSLLNSLSGLLALGAEMELPKESITDVEVTTITDPSSGNFLAGWGVGGGFFAIGTNKGLLEAAFSDGDSKLDDNAIYKDAIDPLPDARSGVFFLNVNELLRVVEGAMGAAERESFEQARSILSPIRAISAGAEPVDANKDSASGTVFVLMGGE